MTYLFRECERSIRLLVVRNVSLARFLLVLLWTLGCLLICLLGGVLFVPESGKCTGCFHDASKFLFGCGAFCRWRFGRHFGCGLLLVLLLPRFFFCGAVWVCVLCGREANEAVSFAGNFLRTLRPLLVLLAINSEVRFWLPNTAQ